jgi:hypothetical protein
MGIKSIQRAKESMMRNFPFFKDQIMPIYAGFSSSIYGVLIIFYTRLKALFVVSFFSRLRL